MISLDEAQSPAPTAAMREFLRNSISIADITKQVWSGRLIVITALVLGFLLGLYQAHRNGPHFMATMSLMPSQGDSSDGASSGAIGVLASLTGGGNVGQVPKFTQFLSVLGSVGVAQVLDRRYDMVCTIYHGLCDPKTHVWRKRTGITESLNAFLAHVAGLPDPNGPLTVVELAQYNASQIIVSKDKNSGMVTLSYINHDAKFSADYLSKVVRTANDYIREQDRTTQHTYVDYVTHRIAANTNVEQRAALDSLLLQQERRLMMTEVDVPYAANILDGPIVTPQNGVLKITLLYGFLFLLGSIAVVLLRDIVSARLHSWSRNWTRS